MASEATATGSSSATENMTPAQLLEHQHALNPTIEEVPDEEDLAHPPPKSDTSPTPVLSEKAAGKQKAEDPAPAKKPSVPFNTASEELFPALGPVKPRAAAPVPTWGKKPASVTTSNGVNGSLDPSNDTSRASTPASGVGIPAALPLVRGPALPTMSLPGKHSERISFHPSQLLPRSQMKKPMNEMIRELNKKSKAKLEHKAGAGGLQFFEATGPVEAVRQILKDAANEVGSKQSIKVPVPSSVRPFIIGRQGSKIQEISKRTGARIQVPKQEPGEDEDAMIDVLIEGNALTAEMARQEIEGIVNERTSTVNLRLKDIPAEFYPFLAGPNNVSATNLEGGREVKVNIPHYTNWHTQAPPQVARGQPLAFVPQAHLPIQISGERVAAQEIQAELERRHQQLRQQFAMEQASIERGRHQFIIGDRGGSLHDFLKETGCSLIFPPGTEDDDHVYVVGPPGKIDNAIAKLDDLASEMAMATADAAREHKGAHAHSHAHNITRYLRQRQALEELERMHEASIVAPTDRDGPTAWEIYSKENKNSTNARKDIMGVFQGHPPSRFSTVSVDPFYHEFLQQRNAQHIREDTGVHLVFPEESEASPELILVYEGTTPFGDYVIPRGAPPAAEVKAYKQALQEAQKFIESITSSQQKISARDMDAPPKFHSKIQKYVDREQASLPRDQIPVQVLFGERRPEQRRRSNTSFAMRGPVDAVDDLTAKILAFIEQEEKDELERGFTLSFDFPQKYANFLIGKGGENIRKLREEFDVDIQVNDGKVELKGPQAKANACKAHIVALGKRLEDEATHTLKIKSQYHRDLIGAKGSQVNRLQDRYNVRINFPRSNKNDDDAGTEGGKSQKNFRSQAADEVIIRGPRKGADEAREELLNLLQYIMDTSHVDTISVQQSQVPQLIGSGGREMESLRLATGCQIDIPSAREGADASARAEIKLKGTKKQVEEAKKLLQERVKVYDDTKTETIEVDRKYHRTLIGGSGSNIRSIVTAAGGPDNARELARMVRFPRAESDETAIRVEGPKSIVDKIVASIKAQVGSLENQTSETLEISPDKHRLLIGRGGETRRSLEAQFNVQLDIPKQTTQGAARSQVKLTGEPAQVEKAKEHILELVKGQEGETILVPLHLHHQISDNGQFFRRLRNEHKITVDHNGAQLPPKPAAQEGGKARKGANGALPLITDDDDAGSNADEKYSWEIVDNNAIPEGTDTSATIPWVLRGPADNLPKAKSTLEAAIENASKPSATGYLILPDPRSYRLVVGPGGSTINSIRKKTGTNVKVPRDQAKDEAIEVVGSKDGCEEARQMILEIIARSGGGGRKETSRT